MAEGEEEEINIIKKITKVFDYNEDIENLGKMMDKIQRKALTKEETDSIYISTTNMLEILNKVKNNEVLPKEIENSLKEIKKEAKEEKVLMESEEFNIFGGMSQDNTKISKIANKKHRELPKDKFNILEVNKNTKQIGYKLKLQNIAETIKNALTKVVITEDLPVYKAIIGDTLNQKDINVFNINPENEIKEILHQKGNKINLYKINIKRGTNAISFTNIIFYDNQNKTLPIGQDLSTKMLVDLSKVKMEKTAKTEFKIASMQDEKDDFSKVDIKHVTVYEYDIELPEKEEKQDKEEVKEK